MVAESGEPTRVQLREREMNLVTADHKVPQGFAHAASTLSSKPRRAYGRDAESERWKKKEEEREKRKREQGKTTVENGTEKRRKSCREVEALAAQKARMQAKKEERDEETGFFQLGQVGASNLGTAASLRE